MKQQFTPYLTLGLSLVVRVCSPCITHIVTLSLNRGRRDLSGTPQDLLSSVTHWHLFNPGTVLGSRNTGVNNTGAVASLTRDGEAKRKASNTDTYIQRIKTSRDVSGGLLEQAFLRRLSLG